MINNLNISIRKETQIVIKSLLTKRSPGPQVSQQNSMRLSKVYNKYFLNYSKKQRKEGILLNSFLETSVTLIP